MLLVINDKCPTKPVNKLAQVLGSTNLHYQCMLHINRIIILIRNRTTNHPRVCTIQAIVYFYGIKENYEIRKHFSTSCFHMGK